MSLNKEKAHATAVEIERAHATGEKFRQLDANVRPATIIDAYAAQNELQLLRAGGKRGTVAGRKIALASKGAAGTVWHRPSHCWRNLQ